MEYTWLPLLQPNTVPESEFGVSPALQTPQANYDLWLQQRIQRLQRSNPRPIAAAASENPPACNSKDIQVDYVCGGTMTTDFEVCYTAHLSSWIQDANDARIDHICSRDQLSSVVTVQAPRGILFDNTLSLRPHIAEQLHAVQCETATELTFLGDAVDDSATLAHETLDLPQVTVQIRGTREDANKARMLLMLMLDQCAGYVCEAYDRIPLIMHHVVAGTDASNLHRIMRTTGTKIYLPSPLAHHARLPPHTQPGWENRTVAADDAIYLAGTRSGIDRAKIALRESSHIALVSNTIAIAPRKLEWILATQSDYVHSLMRKCATFIAMPPVGSANSFITVYGSDRAYVNKTITDLALLATTFHEITLTLSQIADSRQTFVGTAQRQTTTTTTATTTVSTVPTSIVKPITIGTMASIVSAAAAAAAAPAPAPAPASTVTVATSNVAAAAKDTESGKDIKRPDAGISKLVANFDQLLQAVSQIAESTGAEIVISGFTIGIYGPQSAVSPALTAVMNTSQLQLARNTLRIDSLISIEIPQKHEDFLKGKYNGKIKKLASETSVRYDFLPSISEPNVIVRLLSPVRAETVSAYHALTLELPVEMSLMIPEREHHKMIGDKGQNSQRIGAQYHAFLRFSNRIEQTKQCGYFRLRHNVFALTPAKYAKDLPRLRDDLVELYCQVCKPADQDDAKVSSSSSSSTAISDRFAKPTSSSSSSSSSAFGPERFSSRFKTTRSGPEYGLSTVYTVPPSPPQTLFETFFPHHGILHLLPHLFEIEEKHAVVVNIPNMEIGSDLIQVFGTHRAISEALLAIFAVLPICTTIDLPKGTRFNLEAFNGAIALLVDHFAKKFNVLLGASHAEASDAIVLRFTCPPAKADQLSLCHNMALEYLGELLLGSNNEDSDMDAKSPMSEPIASAMSSPTESTFPIFDEQYSTSQHEHQHGTQLAVAPRLQEIETESPKSTVLDGIRGLPTPQSVHPDKMRWEDGGNLRKSNAFLSDLYDVVISPATAAELPCLAPDNWKEVGSRKPRLSLLLSSPTPTSKPAPFSSLISRPAESQKRLLALAEQPLDNITERKDGSDALNAIALRLQKASLGENSSYTPFPPAAELVTTAAVKNST